MTQPAAEAAALGISIGAPPARDAELLSRPSSLISGAPRRSQPLFDTPLRIGERYPPTTRMEGASDRLRRRATLGDTVARTGDLASHLDIRSHPRIVSSVAFGTSGGVEDRPGLRDMPAPYNPYGQALATDLLSESLGLRSTTYTPSSRTFDRPLSASSLSSFGVGYRSRSVPTAATADRPQSTWQPSQPSRLLSSAFLGARSPPRSNGYGDSAGRGAGARDASAYAAPREERSMYSRAANGVRSADGPLPAWEVPTVDVARAGVAARSQAPAAYSTAASSGGMLRRSATASPTSKSRPSRLQPTASWRVATGAAAVASAVTPGADDPATPHWHRSASFRLSK